MESEGGEEPQLDLHRLQRDEEGGGGGHGAGRQRASLSRPLWLSAMPVGEGRSLMPGDCRGTHHQLSPLRDLAGPGGLRGRRSWCGADGPLHWMSKFENS